MKHSIRIFALTRCSFFLLSVGLAPFTIHCSDLPTAPIGHLQVALTSGVGNSHYLLRNASFEVTGDEQLTLQPGEDAQEAMLDRALPEGDYQLRLLDGWQLQHGVTDGQDAEQARNVAATLLSDNPQSFSIETGSITGVIFRFQTASEIIETSTEGELSVGIEVNGQPAIQVLFTEFMANPSTLPDTQGEWFELFNAGSSEVDLSECIISRDTQQIGLPPGVVMSPGSYLTFANSAEPGFSPDLIYSGLSLPNSGTHQMRLSCEAQVLDSFLFDSEMPSPGAGHSLSLSASAAARASNGDAIDWCEATNLYNGDFGSPGSANAECLFAN